MSTIAVIPARSGSTRLPGKNRLRLAQGAPTLVQLAVRCACECNGIDEILVSSDSPDILGDVKTWVLEHGAGKPVALHQRPIELSGAESMIEDLLIAVIGSHDRLVLLNPTSPFRRSKTIADCLGADDGYGARTVAETVLHHYIIWSGRTGVDGTGRPRSQDLPRATYEHGACYVIPSWLVADRRLTHPDGAIVITSEVEAIDIDTPLDAAKARGVWAWVEAQR